MKKDKTALFQGFAVELQSASAKQGSLNHALDEAEAILSPFFENSDMLRTSLGVGALTYEANFLSAKAAEPWVAGLLATLLGEFRTARKTDEKACFETWAQWMNATNRAILNVASAAQLQGKKDDLEPHLAVKSCLRDAADLLEGTLQSFARLRLKMMALGGLQTKAKKQIEELSFGELLEELIRVKPIPSVYQPQPFGLSLSQWRNIANHNSYETHGNQVTCAYGPTGKQKSFTCSVSDIVTVAHYANDLSFAHKIAIEIFSIDNLEQIKPSSSQAPLTDYTKDSALVFGLVSARFRVSQAMCDSGVWHLQLEDELGRNRQATKAALQEACVAYALLCGGCHIEASVVSGNAVHQVGFKASFANRGDHPPTDFRGDVRKLDENFRLKISE